MLSSSSIMNTDTRRRFGKIDHPLNRLSEIVNDLIRAILHGRHHPTDRLLRWRELTSQYLIPLKNPDAR